MTNTVLLIDDDELLRTSLVRLLQVGMRLDVVEAANGRQGMDLLQQRDDIALVIVDIFMPDVDGLEFIRKARKLGTDLRILAISGGSNELPSDFLAHARMMGATDALYKPFETEAFLAAVKKLLDAD